MTVREDLSERISKIVSKIVDKERMYLESLAAAFIAVTGIPPQDAVLVESRNYTEDWQLEVRWHFERRVPEKPKDKLVVFAQVESLIGRKFVGVKMRDRKGLILDFGDGYFLQAEACADGYGPMLIVDASHSYDMGSEQDEP